VHRHSFSSDLNVLGKTSDNISGREVFADVISRFSLLGWEDAITILDSATELLAALPNDLSEVRRIRVVSIILANFVCPRLDGFSYAIR